MKGVSFVASKFISGIPAGSAVHANQGTFPCKKPTKRIRWLSVKNELERTFRPASAKQISSRLEKLSSMAKRAENLMRWTQNFTPGWTVSLGVRAESLWFQMKCFIWRHFDCSFFHTILIYTWTDIHYVRNRPLNIICPLGKEFRYSFVSLISLILEQIWKNPNWTNLKQNLQFWNYWNLLLREMKADRTRLFRKPPGYMRKTMAAHVHVCGKRNPSLQWFEFIVIL